MHLLRKEKKEKKATSDIFEKGKKYPHAKKALKSTKK